MRLLSVPAAIAMCVVAALIPPVAAIAGNKRDPDDRWFDEEDQGDRYGPGSPLTPAHSESRGFGASVRPVGGVRLPARYGSGQGAPGPW